MVRGRKSADSKRRFYKNETPAFKKEGTEEATSLLERHRAAKDSRARGGGQGCSSGTAPAQQARDPEFDSQ